jgi:hypothetical protein
LDCYAATCSSRRKADSSTMETAWLEPSSLKDYPLNSTGRKIATLAHPAQSYTR